MAHFKVKSILVDHFSCPFICFKCVDIAGCSVLWFKQLTKQTEKNKMNRQKVAMRFNKHSERKTQKSYRQVCLCVCVRKDIRSIKAKSYQSQMNDGLCNMRKTHIQSHTIFVCIIGASGVQCLMLSAHVLYIPHFFTRFVLSPRLNRHLSVSSYMEHYAQFWKGMCDKFESLLSYFEYIVNLIQNAVSIKSFFMVFCTAKWPPMYDEHKNKNMLHIRWLWVEKSFSSCLCELNVFL